MSSPIVTGPKRIMQKWRQRRDDAEFTNDMHHFRDLLDGIHDQQARTRGPVDVFPTIMSTTLDIALYLAARDFPDPIAAELAQWRADIAAAAA